MKKIILIGIVILISCTKEEITPRTYPRVSTLATTDISNASAQLNGEITLSSVEIIDHGFIFSTSAFRTMGEKFSMGPKSDIGAFETTINKTFNVGITYYARAYAASSDHIVYGNLVEFTRWE